MTKAKIAYSMECFQANVGEVSTASVACGVLGVGGNKGGVAVSFTLYRRRLCCVSSHFAAHQVLLSLPFALHSCSSHATRFTSSVCNLGTMLNMSGKVTSPSQACGMSISASYCTAQKAGIAAVPSGVNAWVE